MRIISKFSDYYDSVQKYGQDLSTVYLRQEVFLDPKKFTNFKDLLSVYSTSHHFLPTAGFHFLPFIVLVSGRSYVGFQLTFDKEDSSKTTEYCYDEASCLESLRKNSPKHFNLYTEKKKAWRSFYYRQDFNEGNVQEFFKTKIPDTQKICIDHASPIILIGRKGCYTGTGSDYFDTKENLIVVKNPCLKHIEFYKALDTNSTFQEIESFLSGVLPSTVPNTVTISEKNKILKHGFDYKLSFRKSPTKKKP